MSFLGIHMLALCRLPGATITLPWPPRRHPLSHTSHQRKCPALLARALCAPAAQALFSTPCRLLLPAPPHLSGSSLALLGVPSLMGDSMPPALLVDSEARPASSRPLPPPARPPPAP